MLRFIARRAVNLVLVMFAISVITFVIFVVIPNNDPAKRIAGRTANPTVVAQVRKDFGFDDPLPQQYVRLMKKILTCDVVSYSNRTNVCEELRRGVPVTASLVIGAAVIWVFFGLLFGVLSALFAGSWIDSLLTGVAVLGLSLPIFWVGALLVYYLTFKTTIFPSPEYVKLTQDPLGWFTHLILPWFTLAILFFGFYSRLLRSNMLDVMGEDYVRTARAKGLPERRVLSRHVLRNALIPFVTLFGLDFAAAFGGGAILTEKVFNLPGIGAYVADSVDTLDLPPIMVTTLYGAFFIVIFSAFADVAYARLDPRVRLGQ